VIWRIFKRPMEQNAIHHASKQQSELKLFSHVKNNEKSKIKRGKSLLPAFQ
jgi:hypothetical protein